MANHYLLPFACRYGIEAAADDTQFNANIDRTTTFTQYLTPDITGVIRGVLINVVVLCDSANNRTFDLIIQEGAQSGDMAAESRFIFDSQEELGADIADDTHEEWEVERVFVLDTMDRFYYTLHAAAGAFGNCLGYIVFKGIAYF